jgi:hypothetical protein
LSVPFQWYVHESPYDYFRFTSYGLRYLLEKSGYVDIAIEAVTGFWTMWFLKLNYQLPKLIRGPRLLRMAIRLALQIFWVMDQWLAVFLDRYWPGEEETAGYFVTARKPS